MPQQFAGFQRLQPNINHTLCELKISLGADLNRDPVQHLAVTTSHPRLLPAPLEVKLASEISHLRL